MILALAIFFGFIAFVCLVDPVTRSVIVRSWRERG